MNTTDEHCGYGANIREWWTKRREVCGGPDPLADDKEWWYEGSYQTKDEPCPETTVTQVSIPTKCEHAKTLWSDETMIIYSKPCNCATTVSGIVVTTSIADYLATKRYD